MKPIILDLETCAIDNVADYLPPLDLSGITPDKRFTDPAKIADSIAAKTREATEAHAVQMAKAGLDFNLCRVVALGYTESVDGPVVTLQAQTEAEEPELLATAWEMVRHRPIVGFCARTFDLPVLIQRSRYLGVKHQHVNLARYGKGDVMDLFDMLTFDNSPATSIMSRSLKSFAKRFGIPVDDQTDGKDIAAMVAAGDWDGVRAHCRSDVQLTAALAQRVGVI